MQTVSTDFKKALGSGYRSRTSITVTTPDGEERTLKWSGASISSTNASGVRHTASVEVLPEAGVDLYSILSTPGALYRIEHGIDFGSGFSETIPLGVYEAASGGINITDGDISLDLVDQWARVERSRFTAPYSPSADVFPALTLSRAQLIQNAVTDAVPDADFNVLDTGGTTDLTDRVWDKDRTQFIDDIAKDGELDVYFDAAGVFVIRKEPIVDAASSVWTFRTGEFGNIMVAERERPFDRLYNRVVVTPIDETQDWSAVYVDLTDTTNPRHADYIGVVPFFYSSPTLTTQAAAVSAADTILQRVQGTTETLSLSSTGAPMLEVGDTVTVAHRETDADPGFNAIHIIDGWDYDLVTGGMSVKTRSSTIVDSEEQT